MSVEIHKPARKPRIDAQRNRERLIEVAKAAFAEAGADASLEEIARRAGVGIGTLYRHFPTRDAVIEAVYRREVQNLSDAAGRLLETQAPGDALHAWMHVFVDYIAAKKLIAPALGTMSGGASTLFAASGTLITDAVTRLVDAAKAAGEVRTDINADDLLRGLAGLAYASSAPGWEASAKRLIDMLMDGMRRPG